MADNAQSDADIARQIWEAENGVEVVDDPDQIFYFDNENLQDELRVRPFWWLAGAEPRRAFVSPFFFFFFFFLSLSFSFCFLFCRDVCIYRSVSFAVSTLPFVVWLLGGRSYQPDMPKDFFIFFVVLNEIV